MSFSAQDSMFMARAIQLAKKGWFSARVNPRVGCVLVKDNQVIAEGWHKKAGMNHAEVNAIDAAEQDLDGATAYVTLEPCAHYGKQPPCALALIEAGVSKVIGAMQDPNPLVAGKGFAMIKDAGIEVQYGLLQAEAEKLNAGFIKRMQKGLPRVVVKSAISLDGKVAMESGESQWITGEEARADVQRLRAESCAIITGSGTVIHDDPSMNVRAAEFVSNEYFSQPLRVVIDSQGLIEPNAKIFQQQSSTWLVTGELHNKDYPESVKQQLVATQANGKIDLRQLLTQLGQQGINQVLVESGSELAGAFIEQKLVDELVVYMAPTILGSNARSVYQLPFDTMTQSIRLQLMDTRHFGDDIRFTYAIQG